MTVWRRRPQTRAITDGPNNFNTFLGLKAAHIECFTAHSYVGRLEFNLNLVQCFTELQQIATNSSYYRWSKYQDIFLGFQGCTSNSVLQSMVKGGRN